MNKMKLLIVEDDLILSIGLESDLTAMGYDVVGTAQDSDNALQCFSDDKPDLVVMDIDLENSKLDGIEIAKEMKVHRDIPIIFLSGLGGTETIARAKEVDPSYYLIKPCNKRQLQVAIDFALSNFIANSKPSVDHSLKTNKPLSNVIFARNEFFFIKKSSHYQRVDVQNVAYIKAESPGNNIRIITEYENHFLSVGLRAFEKQVIHSSLHRIHRSYIVNIEKIVAFTHSNVTLLVQDKQKVLPIGHTYKEYFLRMFLKVYSDK